VTDPLEAGILDPRREPFTDPRVILSRIVPDSLLADDDEPTVAGLIRRTRQSHRGHAAR
jgi:hypothetical protein